MFFSKVSVYRRNVMQVTSSSASAFAVDSPLHQHHQVEQIEPDLRAVDVIPVRTDVADLLSVVVYLSLYLYLFSHQQAENVGYLRASKSQKREASDSGSLFKERKCSLSFI